MAFDSNASSPPQHADPVQGGGPMAFWAAGGAVGFDLAIRAGVAGLAATLLVAGMATVPVTARPRSRQTVALGAAALAAGTWLSIRSSPWLVLLDVAAVAVLLVCAAWTAGGRSILDIDVRALGAGAMDTATAAVRVPAGLRSAINARGGPGRGILRGLIFAAPLAVVVGSLLASADAIFADFFGSLLDPQDLVLHAVLLGVGGWGAAGLWTLASSPSSPESDVATPRPGAVESLVVVGTLDAILGVFAYAQAHAASEGGRRVLETAGLTYAEYARSGFFQLLAVTAVVLVALALLRATSGRSIPFAVLAVLAVVLTIVVAAVAARRLSLYTDAFGLTMPRLGALFALGWIVASLLLLAVRAVGRGTGRSWLPVAMGACGLAVLAGFNAIDPEALVARTNLARSAEGRSVDASHLAALSDDAVPSIVEGLSLIDREDREAILARARQSAMCDDRPGSWASFNLARRRADAVRVQLCSAPSDGSRGAAP